MSAARREFEEETGFAPAGECIPLDSLQQPGGKHVFAWALGSDFEPSSLRSNTFEIEWPPRSGRRQRFPEVDRAEWFGIAAARRKILKGQAAFLDRLVDALGH